MQVEMGFSCSDIRVIAYLYIFPSIVSNFWGFGNVLSLAYILSFFEIKNAITMQGDIGVVKCIDQSATWQHLSIALVDEARCVRW